MGTNHSYSVRLSEVEMHLFNPIMSNNGRWSRASTPLSLTEVQAKSIENYK
jgi:hypothetical protein